jgi:hypothetical protein
MIPSEKTKKEAFSLLLSVLTLIGSMIGVMVYFNSQYVSKEELQTEKQLRILVQQQTSDQIDKISKMVYQSHSKLSYEIKNSKSYGLMFRRDLLESRSQLTPDEQSELRLLNRKLRELNSSIPENFSVSDIDMNMTVDEMLKSLEVTDNTKENNEQQN